MFNTVVASIDIQALLLWDIAKLFFKKFISI